ncbi:MAG TPA: CopD family protein [Stellaceae bacterium]|nr:CopD family protein [Stellaceae bacterium]
MIIAIVFHVLAAVIWVGGMFFAHVMLRPAAASLEPAIRLPLFRRVLGNFFPWVWASIAVLLASGYGVMLPQLGGFAKAPISVQIMQGLGIIMMLAFFHLFFAPWRRFKRAVDASDYPTAAAQLSQIRRIVLFNLVLGLIVVVVGASGPYWG